MTELEIYKFVQENELEWHHSFDGFNNDVTLFIPYCLMEEFSNMTKSYLEECETIGNATLRYGYLAVEMLPFFYNYGINLENVFSKS